jgi:hypothetical protein
MTGRVICSAVLALLAITNVPSVLNVRSARSGLGTALVALASVCLVSSGTVIVLLFAGKNRPGASRRIETISRRAFRVGIVSWLAVAWCLGRFYSMTSR